MGLGKGLGGSVGRGGGGGGLRASGSASVGGGGGIRSFANKVLNPASAARPSVGGSLGRLGSVGVKSVGVKSPAQFRAPSSSFMAAAPRVASGGRAGGAATAGSSSLRMPGMFQSIPRAASGGSAGAGSRGFRMPSSSMMAAAPTARPVPNLSGGMGASRVQSFQSPGMFSSFNR